MAWGSRLCRISAQRVCYSRQGPANWFHSSRSFAKKPEDTHQSPPNTITDPAKSGTAKQNAAGAKKTPPAAAGSKVPKLAYAWNPRKEGLPADDASRAAESLGPGRSSRQGLKDLPAAESVYIYNLADRTDLQRLQAHFVSQGVAVEPLETQTSSDSKELECLSRKVGVADVFYFKSGSVAIWGLPRPEHKKLQSELDPFLVGKRAKQLYEMMKYIHDYDLADESSPLAIVDDVILFGRDAQGAQQQDTTRQKLALSYALHESVYLMSLEGSINSLIERLRSIPDKIKSQPLLGHWQRKKLSANLLADCLDLRQNVNFSGLDKATPDLFWELPEMEHAYDLMANNLMIAERVDVANSRLDHGMEVVGTFRNINHETHTLLVEYGILGIITLELLVLGLPVLG